MKEDIAVKQVSEEFGKRLDEVFAEEWKAFNLENGCSWNTEKIGFVAYDGDRVLGEIRVEVTGGAVCISSLMVAKEYRKKGVGILLLGKVVDYVKKNNCHVCYLEATEKHVDAVRFYEKAGFERVGELKNNKCGLDCYLYERRFG